MRFKVLCEYMSRHCVWVEVAEGGDPMRPRDWVDVYDEEPAELSLYDTIEAEEVEDE